MSTIISDLKKAVQEETAGVHLRIREHIGPEDPEYIQAYEELAEALLNMILVQLDVNKIETSGLSWEFLVKATAANYAKTTIATMGTM